MDLANPAMNDFMTLMGIRRIEFLKNVGDPALIDDPLINTIEQARVRINENDENQLNRQTIHQDGKVYDNEIPAQFIFLQKINEAK